MRMTEAQLKKSLAKGHCRVVSEVGGASKRSAAPAGWVAPIGSASITRSSCDPSAEPLPLADGHTKFVFPGLRLRSWNTMLGSRRKGPQALAKEEARAAVASAPGLRRFEGACSLVIVQCHPGERRRWDIDGLCAKHLIDELVRRGCFHDDNREVLSPITYDHRVGDLAVEVHVTPKTIGGSEG